MNGISGCSSRRVRFEHLRPACWRVPRFCACARVVGLQRRLRELQVPVAVLVPGEFVQRLRGEVEAILRELRAHFGDRRAEARADPAIRDRVLDVAACWPQSWPSVFISTKRAAFHSLLQKLR